MYTALIGFKAVPLERVGIVSVFVVVESTLLPGAAAMFSMAVSIALTWASLKEPCAVSTTSTSTTAPDFRPIAVMPLLVAWVKVWHIAV
jgi:hypothetical protein